jgi:hypothetical protein
METIDLLKSGQLAGTKRLTLACGLTQLPPELFDLADSLEILDLSNNHLQSLPDEFARFQNLKIAFFSNNDFTEIPAVLSQCPNLSMVGFKSNQISTVGDRALPPSLRWLILTHNKIARLPDSLGEMKPLQKLMLAGNQLQSLPESMANCTNLELIRIAANCFQTLPPWLLELPRLSWLAYAGNPCCPIATPGDRALVHINWADITPGEILGQGASGVITKGVWRNSPSHPIQETVAIKIFKGEMTSDGLPAHEMAACLAAGFHDNLVHVRGKLTQTPEGQEGLVLSLIPPAYTNLGQPPDLETCTRDTYKADVTFELPVILRIAKGIAAVAAHLHERGIMHGDLYAHNILVNEVGDCLLGDFGAASFYDPADAPLLERLEVRAFGCLLEDLLDRCRLDASSEQSSTQQEAFTALRELQQDCLGSSLAQRPVFAEICDRLG